MHSFIRMKMRVDKEISYEKSLEKSQWTLVALLKELHSAEVSEAMHNTTFIVTNISELD